MRVGGGHGVGAVLIGAVVATGVADVAAAITFHFLRNCLKVEPTFQSQSEFASFKKKVSEYKSFLAFRLLLLLVRLSLHL